MTRIYFAGPLFCKAELEFNARLAGRLREAGYDVFLPQETGISLPPAGTPEREVADADAFAEDVREIDACDILLLIMDGRVPDEGACFELGYAYAKGKKLVGLKTDIRVSEQGGDNLMLSVPLRGRLARSEEELLRILADM